MIISERRLSSLVICYSLVLISGHPSSFLLIFYHLFSSLLSLASLIIPGQLFAISKKSLTPCVSSSVNVCYHRLSFLRRYCYPLLSVTVYLHQYRLSSTNVWLAACPQPLQHADSVGLLQWRMGGIFSGPPIVVFDALGTEGNAVAWRCRM